jgi:GTP-binding protein LepA
LAACYYKYHMDPSFIRNFCIIAHIDHGKSTLADRLLEATGTVSARQMTAQFLDSMDLERERGITIKAQAVRMTYNQGHDYQLNLIDTPGHVDFSYEVSRSLAACEGALLVVDATQGIQAQTLANVYIALENDLTIIPVINKIDLPMAEPERIVEELRQVFGFFPHEVLQVSAKDGTGIDRLLEAVVERVPSPRDERSKSLRALIFDSKYDVYKGVVAYVRLFEGSLSARTNIRMIATGKVCEVHEIGVFRPNMSPVSGLEAGEVGYVATGLKDVRECLVGDTVTLASGGSKEPLPGYHAMKPMVFAGLYPSDGDDYHDLRDALERLQLNDASLAFEPETSGALGPGFRCGFLGLLHMEIVQERLEREYGQSLVVTAPSVAYNVLLKNGKQVELHNPQQLLLSHDVEEIQEPWLTVTAITPSRFIGGLMDLMTTRRGEYQRMEYLDALAEGPRATTSPSSDPRVLLEFLLPMAEFLIDLYEQVKTRTQGYASLDYSMLGYHAGPLVRLDILVNNELVDALSLILHRDQAHVQGRALVERLRQLIPRQLFDIPIQAAIGSRIVARETVKALRKNVLAKCYGGDVTRKRKLLEKQAEGKKRMKRVGRVEVPQEAFLAFLTMQR